MANFGRKLALFNIIVGILSACGGSGNGTDVAKRASDSTFRVALLTPGPISDQGWNGSAYAGLMRIKDSLGAQVSHIQTKTPAEFEENFRQYGSSGYALVFGHGFEFQDAASRVAPEFPKTIYVTTGGTAVGPNQAAMSFSFDEPSYLAGILAASMSKSGTVGCIGGTELPPVKSSFVAFAAGVRAVRPDAKVLTSYIGNWEDAGAGKEQALAQIGRGVDVIFQNADAAGLGVFQAVKQSTGVFIIGSNANQNAIAPAITLGSVVIDVPHALMVVAREVRAGTFTPRVIKLDTKSDVVRWVPNPTLVATFPPAAAHRLDSLQTLMRAGAFTIPAAK
jgi:basic membrane protein A